MTLSELLLNDLSRLAVGYPEIDWQPILHAQRSILERTETLGRGPTFRKIDRLYALKPDGITLDGKSGAVKFAGNITSEFNALLKEVLAELKAWRKGPFDFFGTEVDAEWRADLKFERLNLKDLSGKKVVDVGAGNGYYMLRLLALDPDLVLGIDPTDRYLLQYYLLRVLCAENPPMAFALDRDSLLESFRGFFDIVMCLGVFYHHPEPSQLLDKLFHSLTDYGELYLETLYFESASLNFGGTKRYAKMKNVYLIPSPAELKEMLVNSGFNSVETLSETEVGEGEQRSTAWAPGDSLSSFIDKDSPELTVEGHPRPRRIILKALKGKL